MKLLQTSNVVNNVVVIVPSFHYRYIVGKDKTKMVGRWIKKHMPSLQKITEIYIPVNQNCNHWCLVVINIWKKEIVLLDSMYCESTASTIFSNILKILLLAATSLEEQENMKSWMKYSRLDVPQQTDNNSCGVFMLEFERRIMAGNPINFPNHASYIRKVRKRIMVELVTDKLMGNRTETELETYLFRVLDKIK